MSTKTGSSASSLMSSSDILHFLPWTTDLRVSPRSLVNPDEIPWEMVANKVTRSAGPPPAAGPAAAIKEASVSGIGTGSALAGVGRGEAVWLTLLLGGRETPSGLRVLLATPVDLLVASMVAERKSSSSLTSASSSDEDSPEHAAVKENYSLDKPH